MNTTIYLHSDKQQMYETGTEIGLKGNALDYFLCAASEVSIGLDVDKHTGMATIVTVDGRPVGKAKP